MPFQGLLPRIKLRPAMVALPALPMLSAGVVVALAPHSLRVPAADRKKGLLFAGVLTLLVALRLAAWAGWFDGLTNR